MTDEAAKLLADAVNNLAAALNQLPRANNGLMSSISVYHHGSAAHSLLTSIYNTQLPGTPSSGGSLS